MEVDEWIINRFNEKKETKNVGHGVALYADPFISYLAEESVQNYLIESVVYYINLPNKLEVIDEEMFNHIKDDIMQNIKVTSEESENYEK
ncbi:hypothetical protein D3C85_1255700 [compost metagenome]